MIIDQHSAFLYFLSLNPFLLFGGATIWDGHALADETPLRKVTLDPLTAPLQ